jgi:hypothetical protein
MHFVSLGLLSDSRTQILGGTTEFISEEIREQGEEEER